MAGGDRRIPVITVKVKEVAVVASRDLSLNVADREFFHTQLRQDLRQDRLDTCQDKILMFAEIHEDAGPAMVVVDDAIFGGRRNDLAAFEISFMVECEPREFR